MTITLGRTLVAIDEPCHDNIQEAFAQFPSGVVALCAQIGDRPVGFAASSFQAVSWDPPLVSVSVQKASNTWKALRESPCIGISMLSQHQGGLAYQLSSRNRDRFADVEVQVTEGGAVYIDGASAWLRCSVAEEIPAGDHTIVLLKIDGVSTREQLPMVYHQRTVCRLTA